MIKSFTVPIMLPSSEPLRMNKETWTLYMRRGDKFYFRSPFGKITIEQEGLKEHLSSLKYGDKVKAEW